MNAIIKFLLQSGQPPGTSKTYIYTLEKATTKADLKPDSCWDLKALQAEAAAKSSLSVADRHQRGRARIALPPRAALHVSSMANSMRR